MQFDWRKTVSAVAPTLGAALGGPLGALAGKVIGQVVAGKDDATEAEIEEAVGKATPEQLLALKQANLDFNLALKQLDFDTTKLDYDDKANAREREKVVRDKVPGILAGVITLGFFGVLGFMLMRDVPSSSRDVLNIMLGSLGTAWLAVVYYYFGSSSGSVQKTELLAAKK